MKRKITHFLLLSKISMLMDLLVSENILHGKQPLVISHQMRIRVFNMENQHNRNVSS